MRKASSVIEINGNRYDALTGQLIGVAKKVIQPTKQAQGGVIDGFVKGTSHPKAKHEISPTSAKAIHHETKKEKRPAKTRLRHTAQAVHRRAQKSKTLMRSSVVKPKQEAEEAEIIKAKIKPTPSSAVNPSRASRAKVVAKSAHISRFGSSHESHEPAQTIQAKTRARPTSEVAAEQSATVQQVAHHKPNVAAGLTNSQLERLLDHALTRAGAHKKSSAGVDDNLWQRIKAMPKWASIGASLAIVLILGGFFAWQNVPHVSMRLAASRAGVSASVPGYTPAGFSFSGPITYSSGAVSIRYSAGEDKSKSYSVVQQKSNLDSEALASSDLPADSQVHEVNGTRVFIYGDGKDATWVNRGIRYTIEDQAGLSSEQIMKIVGSL